MWNIYKEKYIYIIVNLILIFMLLFVLTSNYIILLFYITVFVHKYLYSPL